MRPHALSILLAATITLPGSPSALGAQACKPQLSIKSVQPSEIENMEWTWSAVVNVNASRCAATAGRFDIFFLRLKDDSPDLEFHESFAWRTGESQTAETEVTVNLWYDERVDQYVIGHIAPCTCRN